MKLRTALIAGVFAALMAGVQSCPCVGNAASGVSAPDASYYYYCGDTEQD